MASLSSDPENVRAVEKKVKKRKEKKKKDRVADVSDHTETQPQIVKGIWKNQKAEDPGTPTEPEPVSSNPEGKGKKRKSKHDQGDEEPPSDDKKRKKRRKEQMAGATDSRLEVTDVSGAVGPIVTASKIEGEKKQRKNKSSAETPNAPPSAVGPALDTDAVGKPGKSRERKATKDDAISDPIPKSKSKKRREEEGVQGEDRPSQKRRKSKASVHPDPLDDPDLTEQSQKALTYIYSRSTSPEAWKFNKARQNWIIRNLWTPKIPERYVPMVVDYLSKVQGRVREILIESCNKVISGSNSLDPPTVQAGTGEKDSSGNPSPSAITGSEKTQRAYTLLYALTKKS